MGEWILGAIINLFGSLGINFGTNLLKLGHDERERLAVLDSGGNGGKVVTKPIICFPTWRAGLLIFSLGNCLNFISFAYAAQSLLAALGSIQFVSNIAFAYFVLKKTVTGKVVVATVFIVLGNLFLVAFGNHQSPGKSCLSCLWYNSELYSSYNLYCSTVLDKYSRGELLPVFGFDLSTYWHLLLPLSYATVSGAIGSCSVLFAKSLSNLLRLTIGSRHQLHRWFTYSMLLLFLSTAGFWMARLNEGLSLYDAIIIVPMFQIAWTFFSIFTGFIYFQEYQVFDSLRISMFLMGMMSVFVGISLLAPEESKGTGAQESASASSTSNTTSIERLGQPPTDDTDVRDVKSFALAVLSRVKSFAVKAKTACTLSLGLREDEITASSVLAMPMVSAKMTGFRGSNFDRVKLYALASPSWSDPTGEEDSAEDLESSSLIPQ